MKKLFIFLTILCTSAFWAQSHKQLIQNYLDLQKSSLNLTASDISDWTIDSEVYGQGTQITSCYIQQNFQGVRVFTSSSTVAIKNNEVVHLSLNFTAQLRQKINTTQPQLSVEQGYVAACQQLQIAQTPVVTILEQLPQHQYKLSDGLQDDPISCQLVFQSMPNNRLVLAWYYQFYSPDAKHLWDVRIDAVTGQLLDKHDLMLSCNFGHASTAKSTKPFRFTDLAFAPKSSLVLAPNPGT
jgi:Zn-dependent metalloprotease